MKEEIAKIPVETTLIHKGKIYLTTHDINQIEPLIRAETLREVGEWLEKREHKVDCLDGQISRGFNITPKDIESLKSGHLE